MVKLIAEKSGLPTIAAINGVSRSLVKAETTVAKAAPTTTPTAMSTTLPRRMNCLKPLSMKSLPIESRLLYAGGVAESIGEGGNIWSMPHLQSVEQLSMKSRTVLLRGQN